MTLGRRPPTNSRRPSSGGSPPPWLVFLIAVAVVFGVYYLWLGVQDFMATDGMQILAPTDRAATETATAQRFLRESGQLDDDVSGTSDEVVSPVPTFTPIPECTDFTVSVERAIVRIAPNREALTVDVLEAGEPVCVISRAVRSTDWYLIDRDPETRRINEGYMFENIIEAVNPTPTPSATYTPAPTVTPVPTDTPTITPSPAPTATRDPSLTDTPTPTPTPTPTIPFQSA